MAEAMRTLHEWHLLLSLSLVALRAAMIGIHDATAWF